MCIGLFSALCCFALFFLLRFTAYLCLALLFCFLLCFRFVFLQCVFYFLLFEIAALLCFALGRFAAMVTFRSSASACSHPHEPAVARKYLSDNPHPANSAPYSVKTSSIEYLDFIILVFFG